MTALLQRSLQVGDVIGPLRAGPVSRTTLALFAGGSGDHNDVHLDVDAARAAGLDDVFAQGMLSMAYLGRLLTDELGHASVLSCSARFTAITPVGAEPVCSGTVVAVEGGVASLALSVDLSDGTTTLVGTARISLEGTAQ